MKPWRTFFLVLLALAILPARGLACAACYGASDSPLATGMNWGIAALLGVVGTVLTCFLAFFVHIIRKGEAAGAELDKITAANEATEKI